MGAVIPRYSLEKLEVQISTYVTTSWLGRGGAIPFIAHDLREAVHHASVSIRTSCLARLELSIVCLVSSSHDGWIASHCCLHSCLDNVQRVPGLLLVTRHAIHDPVGMRMLRKDNTWSESVRRVRISDKYIVMPGKHRIRHLPPKYRQWHLIQSVSSWRACLPAKTGSLRLTCAKGVYEREGLILRHDGRWFSSFCKLNN